MDELIEDCPVYSEMDGSLCSGYFEGELCDRSCRYLKDAVQELLEPGKERLETVEGYEF